MIEVVPSFFFSRRQPDYCFYLGDDCIFTSKKDTLSEAILEFGNSHPSLVEELGLSVEDVPSPKGWDHV